MSRSTLALRQRIEFRIARLLAALPPRAQLRLSGRPPVTRDGQTLAPDLQLLLAGIERRGRPPYEEMSLEQARREMRAGAIVAGGTPDPAIVTRELEVAGAEGPLRSRLYLAPEARVGSAAGADEGSPAPLILFLHGGGFVLGDIDSHDVPCRLLARHAGAHVLSIEYRMAPEHPFPAPVHDACAALGWAHAHAAQLGADGERVAICGDSAGGNLAAVATHLSVRAGRPAPVLQILLYPATDLAERAPSHELFDEGFLLIRRDMDWFADQYLGEGDRRDPRGSIIRAEDLRGLPPAIVVTAGFDPLRDEGEAFAARLRAAGVPVLVRRFPGLIHGFANLTGLSRTSRDAMIEVGGAARAMLSRPPAARARPGSRELSEAVEAVSSLVA